MSCPKFAFLVLAVKLWNRLMTIVHRSSFALIKPNKITLSNASPLHYSECIQRYTTFLLSSSKSSIVMHLKLLRGEAEGVAEQQRLSHPSYRSEHMEKDLT